LFELLRQSGVPERSASLSFVPAGLFTLGSPIGMFLHCADDVPAPSFTLPGGTRYYNIFHPLDPVAYRVEPLLVPELGQTSPAMVPTSQFWGGVRPHHAINKLVSWATRSEKPNDIKKKSSQLRLNCGERIDWELQGDLNIIGEAGEILKALPSHSCYFTSENVAEFVRDQATSLASAIKEPPAVCVAETTDIAGSIEANNVQATSLASAIKEPPAVCVAETTDTAGSTEAKKFHESISPDQ